MPDQPYSGPPLTLKLPIPLDVTTLGVWGEQLNQQGFAPLVATINSLIDYLNGDTVIVAPVVRPAVALAAPASAAVVYGAVAIKARLAATTTVNRVVAQVDGADAGVLVPDATGGYLLAGLDTTRYADGAHQLTVRATDTLGNFGTDSISLTFANNALITDTGEPIATSTGEPLVTA